MHALHSVAAVLKLDDRLSEPIPPTLGLYRQQVKYHVSTARVLIPRVIAIETHDVQKLRQMATGRVGIYSRG